MKQNLFTLVSRVLLLGATLSLSMSAGAESVTVETPGTLPDLLSSAATEATIIGSINGTDVKYLRQLINEEHLTSLDLSKTNFVSGGEAYYDGRYTQDGVIHEYMFYKCENLKEIVLPTSITDINQWAFAYSGLTSIEIPDNITTIHYYAFSYCDKLNRVLIGGKMDYLGRGIFYKSNIQDAYVKTMVPSSIGEKCFSSSPKIHVFNGAKTSYQETDWNGFGTLVDDLDGILPTLNLREDIMFMDYFEDAACTRLKPEYVAMDDEELVDMMKSDILSDNLIKVALKIKNSDWAPYEKEFRIHDYKPYSNASYWHDKLNTREGSFMGNPTGIYSSTSDTLYVFVDQDVESDASLYLASTNTNIIMSYYKGTKLHKGLNIIEGHANNSYYVLYTAHTMTSMSKKLSEWPDIKIHIEGACVDGYYDATRHSNEDYQTLIQNAKREFFIVKGKYSCFNFKTESYREKWPDEIIRSISWFDSLAVWTRELIGVSETSANAKSPNCISGGTGYFPTYYNNPLWAVEWGEFAGYSSSYRTEYMSGYVGTSFNTYKSGFFEWVAAHEVGHSVDNPISIATCGEVSNNLLSCVAVLLSGRRMTPGPSPSSIMKNYVERKPFVSRGEDKYRMFYQLFLYYHQAQRMTSFYPTLFHELRKDNVLSDGLGPSTLKFVRKVCEVANEDLTDFFRMWGFFEPCDITYYDKGDCEAIIKQKDIDSTLAEISKYPKKNREILFVEDRIEMLPVTDLLPHLTDTRYQYDGCEVGKCGEMGQFSDYWSEKKTVPSYTYSQHDSLVVMFGNGGVGFIFYDENENLLFASNKKRFILPDGVMKQNYTIYAVDADGKLYELRKNLVGSAEIALSEAGTLCGKVDSTTIHASISGMIDDNDVKCLRQYIDNGVLESLDLFQTTFHFGDSIPYDEYEKEDGNKTSDYMFAYAKNLKTVLLPDAQSIPERMFSHSGLVNVVISDSVRTIGMDAFSYCYNMNTATIGANVEEMKQGVFYKSNLNHVYVKALTPPALNASEFTSSPTIHVYKEALESYKDSKWAKYGTIVGDLAEVEEVMNQPDTLPCQKILVQPAYDEIENFKGNTYFIVGVVSKDNESIVSGFKNDSYRLEVTITDETSGESFDIKKYTFNKKEDELQATSYLRLNPCQHGIVPELDHTYTIALNIYEGSTMIYTGVSEKGAFDKFNNDFETNGPVVFDTVPFPYDEAAEINISAHGDEIVNYQGNTYFLVDYSTSNNALLVQNLRSGDYRLRWIVKDEVTGQIDTVEHYVFEDIDIELPNQYMRLNPCRYGIVPVIKHSYTVSLQVFSDDVLLYQGMSDEGEFDQFNDAFRLNGAIVSPEDAFEPKTFTPSACYDEIENYKGRTFFITCISSDDNATLFSKLKSEEYHLQWIVEDETTGRIDMVDNYLFDNPSLEFDNNNFLRLNPCKYGIIPEVEHRYTTTLKVYAGDSLVSQGISKVGEFDNFNTAFQNEGPIEEPDVNEPQRITVLAGYDEIENYKDSTYFIVKANANDNAYLYAKLRRNGFRMRWVVKDETTTETDTVENYLFVNKEVEIDVANFLRLNPCRYGIIPMLNHEYTISLELYDGEDLRYYGESEKGDFNKFNSAFKTYGPIVPDPYTVPGKMTISPYANEIENYKGDTYFIIKVSLDKREELYDSLKSGGYRLRWIVRDETTERIDTVEHYEFTKQENEFYKSEFMRLNPCRYGIIPVVDHAYTITMQIYDGEALLYQGTSSKGAFDKFNEAFISEGPIISTSEVDFLNDRKADTPSAHKIIRDNQVIIIRNGEEWTVSGRKIR